jgi:hypothetical protein
MTEETKGRMAYRQMNKEGRVTAWMEGVGCHFRVVCIVGRGRYLHFVVDRYLRKTVRRLSCVAWSFDRFCSSCPAACSFKDRASSTVNGF